MSRILFPALPILLLPEAPQTRPAPTPGDAR